MKQNAIASLAALALLSAGSLAYAAEVTGGNVAVVVQRASVPSASGYQLLCVPVKGLDITGSATPTSLTLDQVLPPAAYGIEPASESKINDTAQCTVTMYLPEGDPETAEIAASYANSTWSYAWKNIAATQDLGGTSLKCGTVLWFFNPKDIAAQPAGTGDLFSALSQTASVSLLAEEESSPTTQVTFCGQQNTNQSEISCGGTSTLKKIGNETSEDLKLSALFNDATCGEGTQLFRIAESGDANYTIYVKRPTGWVVRNPKGGSESISLEDVKLAPGEAIYYFAIAL